MAEPDEVEEDLFADLYEGDENTGSGNTAAPVATQSAPNDAAARSSDAPGYGEEPEIAYDPTSFETEPSGQDHPISGFDGTQNENKEPDRPQPDYGGINMKEDG
ncbi:hypothetical protein A1O3_06495 [Capronia epimyces CBS 606.96]|uniref:Uncharacterized protein n=1 Tax=Capronia epimyces CBS 606.96 TaxID=1182542 RepID=W9Y0B0_9EURO|nr:uncharacterized protein A1O3_06495 [Capronia epimyces CBS 606.96]EXJ82681.1 hypothetical protein A1O3_06495 [Capronia epimyces CBS 606.96]